MDDEGCNLAAPTIFILVALLQLIPRYFEHRIRDGGVVNAEEKKLRAEIKQLLREARTLTHYHNNNTYNSLELLTAVPPLTIICFVNNSPSTFAQSAKLKRLAAAKEKELAKLQEKHMMERRSSYDPYMKYVTPVKAFTYLLLGVWFWKYPVASISKELVQPFGRMLLWKSGVSSEDKVMVGIVPWLILCTRVSKLMCQKISL